MTSLPVCGFIAQLVEHSTTIQGGHRFKSHWSREFFWASSFQFLQLKNLLWWSFFTFMLVSVLHLLNRQVIQLYSWNILQKFADWSTIREDILGSVENSTQVSISYLQLALETSPKISFLCTGNAPDCYMLPATPMLITNQQIHLIGTEVLITKTHYDTPLLFYLHCPYFLS